MTSPAEPASPDAAPASHAATPAAQLTRPLRELIALVLLGANAVLLFTALVRLLDPTGNMTFTTRAATTFFSFVGVENAGLPLLAVLLATHLAPVAPRAKLITQVALGEFAVGALFGGLTFLVSTVGRLTDGEVLDAFLSLLTSLAVLAIFAAGAFLVYKVWRGLYYTPKPKPQPGVYGQPQPGWPQQPAGQPGPQGGWTAPGQPTGWSVPPQPGGYPVVGQPGPVVGQYGQPAPSSAPPYPAAPQSAPPSAAPQPTRPFTPPQSAPPFTPPQSAPPQSVPPFVPAQPAPPFGQPPSAEPTQAIPRQLTEPGQAAGRPGDDSDRTQPFNRDDPNQSH
ncbi:hypothetical protein ACFY2R_23295 [Micromonospora olivasterospora]|uniref:hypothetical protein n=1 Tax=Micromonospora olivasterospora TaxID=1880 RepID=UPI0031DEBD5B